MKSVLVFTAFAGFFAITAADPPACLLSALGQQRNPASVSELCTELQSVMIGNMTSACNGEALKAAYDVYASTCTDIGIKVADLPATAGTRAAPTSTPGASGASVPDATTTPSSTATTTTTGDGPHETKPSAAGAIAPHALLFTVLGLSATGLVSVVFL